MDKGLCRAIGISNFSITKTERLLKTAKMVPAVNQVECHPYFQQPKLKKYCDMKGILSEGGVSLLHTTPYNPYQGPNPNPREGSERERGRGEGKTK